MSAALLLAAVLCQHPFGEPPQEVQRADPVAEWVGGEWRMLGPLPLRGRAASESVLSRKLLESMKPGAPWSALDEPFETPGGLRLLWRDVDLDALADASAAEFLHPRVREGLETGRVELARIPALDADDEPRAAVFYRVLHARKATEVTVELQASGKARLWVNGRLTGEHEETRGGSSPLFTFELARGLNHLVIETASPRSSKWSFELRHRHALTQAAVDRAIDAGVRFLLSRQQADGAWIEFQYYRSGATALALLALLKSDLPRNHPAAQRALAAIRREPPHQTYALALALLAVNAFGDPAHDAWIEEMAGDLVEWQAGNGLWGYPDGGGDLSNTQFAALALHAAAQRGVKIPKGTWRDLVQATLSCRPNPSSGSSKRGPTGFGYSFSDGAYASMTAAGVGTLQICGNQLGDDFSPRMRAAIDSGVAWLGVNCPLHAALGFGDRWTTYMLYGLERTGALTHLERFDKHPWYAEGAAWLLEQQHGNGAWTSGQGCDVDTSFALLFLTRATAKAAVTLPGGDIGAGRLYRSTQADGPLILRAALGSTLDLWIDVQSPDFSRYARVVYWVQAPGAEWEAMPGGATKRFDARVDLKQPGVWQVRASAFLHDGRSSGSGTLEIPFGSSHATTQFTTDLVMDPEANLLRGGMGEAKASTVGNNTQADSVCDQSSATRWMCAEGDPAPWIEVQLKRRARGRALVLRPAIWLTSDPDQQAEPARVRISVNDEEPFIAELSDERPARWTIDLGRALDIRKVRIEILEARRGRIGECSVGFGGIEIHERALAQE